MFIIDSYMHYYLNIKYLITGMLNHSGAEKAHHSKIAANQSTLEER